MSPEQLTAKPVDGRSDIFSLGTILYWLLTGKRPFAGDTLAALSYSVVHGEPPPLAEVAPGLPSDLEYVVKRALAKDPAQRYATGKELAHDLDDLLHGRPPRSRGGAAAAAVPTPVAATIAMPAPVAKKRRRWIVPVVGVAVLLVALGLGAWWWLSGLVPAEPEATKPAPAATPVTRTSSPPPRTTPTRPAAVELSTLRLRGSHKFDSGTLYAYADGKFLTELRLEGEEISANLRVPSDTETITIRIKATSRSENGRGWVPPGQRKKKAGGGASVRQFDQQSSIRARFESGGSRTLQIQVREDIELRWGD
jgi:hypothetical protein